jgi:hypothetical protein
MENNQFYSINGNIFTMAEEVIDRRYCSLRQTGYLIVPDGRLIVVPPGVTHHGVIFSKFLSKYLEKTLQEICEEYRIEKVSSMYNIFIIGPIMADYGFVAYANVASNPQRPIMNNRCGENGALYDVRGLFYIPECFDNLPYEQRMTLLELVNSNMSISGKERYDINFSIKNQFYSSIYVKNILENTSHDRVQKRN